MAKRKKILKNSFLVRLTILVGLMLFFLLILFGRLFQIQVIDRQEYVKKAKKQYIVEAELTSDRGTIYDRTLEPLAVNRQSYSIGLDVTKVSDPEFAATHFSVLFGRSKQSYLDDLKKNKPFLWLSRRANKEKANILDSLSISGVVIKKESTRFYPKGALASHVIGFTNIDLKGLNGIELAKNWELTGNNGLVYYTRDARGNRILDMTQPVKKPQKGKDVVLTINNTVQWIAEEELKYAVEKFEADAGVILITNPKTGEMMALAVSPTFSPNEVTASTIEKRRNRAITDSYEPGSTFKSFIVSAIIEKGLKKPDDIIFCENGKYKIYDRIVQDVSPHGWLTLANIIKKSSNIGMTKISAELKPGTIYQYVRDFGFGLEMGIDLPGEVSGELKGYTRWSKYTPFAMAIGYEISATPLQMTMAYGAIANGGFLLKPKICLSVVDKVEKKSYEAKPEVIRRVISESTARTLTDMLEGVVKDGTGKRAYIKGLRIAGKTGTAMKYDTQLKRYSDDKFVSSFVGFFPADSPQMLIYVMIDNPRLGHIGGKVAAPTFKKIVQRVLRFVDIVPESNVYFADKKQKAGENKQTIIPDLTNRRIETAKEIANQFGLELIVENTGDLIATQKLVLSKNKNVPARLIVKLKKLNETRGGYTFVPSVKGLGLRDAVAKLSKERLRVIVHGSGNVVRQSPKPGEKIRRDACCVVECESEINLAQYKNW